MRHFSNEQLLMARKADLYDYLLTHHADDFVMEGRSIRMLDNHSISIREGQTGYRDFATDESGNSVDFLVRYMGYELDDAIFALCRNTEEEHITTYTRPVLSVSENDLPPEFPAPASSYEQMFAYLMSRGIPAVTIQMLVDQGLLYQSADHNNCVFINREKDWAEIRGTYTFGKPYHGIVSHARKDGFWWFRTDRSAKICYVCEASIDAISLYELHKRQVRHESAYYIGIGGVAKQEAINRVKKHCKTIIAVDNDAAGDGCRERNPECETIRPENKDWNEDLQKFHKPRNKLVL